jgi:hypothetical protein
MVWTVYYSTFVHSSPHFRGLKIETNSLTVHLESIQTPFQGVDQESDGHSDSSIVPLWRWENLPEGQPSLQHSTNQAFIVEWPAWSHSSVKGTWQPAWSLEAWWRHHAVGIFFSARDWETSQDRGKDEWSKLQSDPWKPASEHSVPQTRAKVHLPTGQHDPKQTATTTQEWLRDQSLNVLAWPVYKKCRNFQTIYPIWMKIPSN